MGNCASYPKTNEGDEAPVPGPVPVPAEEVKVEQQENKAEENVVEAKTEETPVASADNSLVTLLNEVYTLVTFYTLILVLFYQLHILDRELMYIIFVLQKLKLR